MGSLGNEALLYNPGTLFDWLKEVTQFTELMPIYGPGVIKFSGPDPQKTGLTGLVIIADSHITIHTYPETHQVFIDIFSCRDFNEEELLRFISETLKLKARRIVTFPRGPET